MYQYSWPVTLPQNPLDSYSESGGVNMLRTPTDSGTAKQRYRGLKPKILNVAFLLTDAQVAIFETFVNTTIKGVARYGWTPPRYSTVQEVRIVSSDGNLYNLTYAAPDRWTVTFQLEILP